MSTAIEDIVKAKEVISIEESQRIINRALSNFNLDTTKAKELVIKSSSVSIATSGYPEVLEAWRILKNARLDTEKTGKALRDFSNEYNKVIKGKENELVTILEKEEDRLYKEKKQHEDKREAEKEAERQEELRLLQIRVDSLARLGVTLDLNYLKALDEQSFQNILERETTMWNELEQERLEAIRLEEELELEKNRIAEETTKRKEEEFEKLKEELRQANIDKQAMADKILAEESAKKEAESLKEYKLKAADTLKNAKIAKEKALKDVPFLKLYNAQLASVIINSPKQTSLSAEGYHFIIQCNEALHSVINKIESVIEKIEKV